MKFAADEATEIWVSTRPVFEWDEGNSTKSFVKHAVTCEESEELIDGPFVFVGRVVIPPQSEPRYVLIGRTKRGRVLAMAFTRRGDKLRPISTRAARAEEKVFYGETTGN